MEPWFAFADPPPCNKHTWALTKLVLLVQWQGWSLGISVSGKPIAGSWKHASGHCLAVCKTFSHAPRETACPRRDFSRRQPAPGEGKGTYGSRCLRRGGWRPPRCLADGKLLAGRAALSQPLPGPAAPGSETARRVAPCPSQRRETVQRGSSSNEPGESLAKINNEGWSLLPNWAMAKQGMPVMLIPAGPPQERVPMLRSPQRGISRCRSVAGGWWVARAPDKPSARSFRLGKGRAEGTLL